MSNSCQELLVLGSKILREQGVPSPALDASILLSFTLGTTRNKLALNPPSKVSEELAKEFRDLIEKRSQFVPVAYLTRKKEFYGEEFFVAPGVLIPRPDTEIIVEIALDRISSEKAIGFEIGTGSGCIAETLARLRPHWKVLAGDISSSALKTAKKNFKSSNSFLIQADLLFGLTEHSFDFIISNPPYVDPKTRPNLTRDLSYEPDLALFSSNHGLFHLEKILQAARNYLKPGGRIFLEHGYDQGAACRNLGEALGYTSIQTHKDLGNNDRVFEAIYGSSAS